jgi:hypothetical protein
VRSGSKAVIGTTPNDAHRDPRPDHGAVEEVGVEVHDDVSVRPDLDDRPEHFHGDRVAAQRV